MSAKCHQCDILIFDESGQSFGAQHWLCFNCLDPWTAFFENDVESFPLSRKHVLAAWAKDDRRVVCESVFILEAGIWVTLVHTTGISEQYGWRVYKWCELPDAPSVPSLE